MLFDTFNFIIMLPVHAYMTVWSPVIWVNSHFGEGSPVPENYVAVVGPRYLSSKIDIPGTTLSAWIYAGDEPAWGDCRPLTADPVDENTFAYRIDFRPTESMRGDESR